MSEDIKLIVGADTTPMESQIKDATRRVGTVKLNAEIDSKGLDSLSRPLGRLTGQADEFTKSMEAANARVLAFGASVGVINGISAAFGNLISSTLEVEKSLAEISATGGETFSNLQKVSSGIFDIAKRTGLSFKDAAEATLEFSRQGKGLEQSLQSAQAALVLTRTTGLDAAEAVKGLTAAVNSFNDPALNMVSVVNKLAAVDSAFAVSSKDLIEGISRSASVAQEAGASFDELTALITTLQEKTGRGGAVIGNAIKTIFTRVQNPEILKDIKELGIAVQDISTGNFLPAVDVLKNLANNFNKLDDNLRKSLLLKVGGGFQIDKLAALLDDLKDANGTFQGSLSVGAGASFEAYERILKINKTVEGSFQNLLSSSKELGSNIGRIGFSEQFIKILEKGSSLVEGLNEAIFGNSEDQGKTIGSALLKGIGSVVSGPGLAVFLGIIAKLGYDFIKFSTSALQTQLGIATKSKEEESIRNSISKILDTDIRARETLYNLEGNSVEQARLLLNLYKEQANEVERRKKLAESVAPLVREGGISLASGTPQIKGAADGYFPNLAQAVNSEKQQAPKGSKILIDHNFPMGGGQRGTMVYNSNETRVKNFAGSGGDAIIPNYPISAVKGYVPNFAKESKEETERRKSLPSLALSAKALSIAGITLAGKESLMSRTKGYPLTKENIGKYKESPLVPELEKYSNFYLTDLPVGNVYRFRKNLAEEEEIIKDDFVKRGNDLIRPSMLQFFEQELNHLGLKPGPGLGSSLSKLKFNLINYSQAGYLLEEILKAPSITDAEKFVQYKNESNTASFDIKNLDPSIAEAYGLPKGMYHYSEIKLDSQELYDTISEKALNQMVYETGGSSYNKKVKNSAKGYYPFNKKASDIGKFNKADWFDRFNGSVIIDNSLKNNKKYDDEAQEIADKLIQESKVKNIDDIKKPKQLSESLWKTVLGNLKNYQNSKNKSRNVFLPLKYSIKGALGEQDTAESLDIKLNSAGSIFDIGNNIDVKTVKNLRISNIIEKGIKQKLLNNNYKNDSKDEIDLKSLTAIVPEDTNIINAVRGFIPNFANYSNLPVSRSSKSLLAMPMNQINALNDSPYATGLTGTNPSADPKGAVNDIVASMLGVNFFASQDPDLINTFNRKLSTTYGPMVTKNLPMFGSVEMPSSTKYQPKQIIGGEFSGKTIKLNYDRLGDFANNIFNKSGKQNEWKQLQDLKINNTTGVITPKQREVILGLTAQLRPFLISALTKNKNVSAVETTIGQRDAEFLVSNLRNQVPDTPETAEKIKNLQKNASYLMPSDLRSLNLKRGESSLIDSFALKDLSKRGQTLQNFADQSFLFKRLSSLLKDEFTYKEWITSKSILDLGNKVVPNLGSFIDKNYTYKEEDANGRFGAYKVKKKVASESLKKLRGFLNIFGNYSDIVDFNNVDIPKTLSNLGVDISASRGARNASGGYIPNFAYDLGTNKDNISIKSVTAPFDEEGNRIRGSGAVKEAILAAIARAKSKGFSKISADIISGASLNAFTKYFGSAVKGKNTWNISDFKNAANGYIPNFANSIQAAIAREKVQSGLPESQISVTKDSRLINSLNPSGYAVINKRDEPNGNVPANRIKDAYNAAKGYTPNFSDTPIVQVSNALRSGKSPEEISKIDNTQIVATKKAQTEAIQQETKATVDVANQQKIIAETLKKFAVESGKTGKELEQFNKVIDSVKLTLDEEGNLRAKSRRELEKELSNKVSNLKRKDASGFVENALKQSTNTIPSNPQNANATNTNAGQQNTKQENNDKKPSDKATKEIEKSFTDIAAKIFFFQSALSLTSGFLSAFGEKASKVGESINEFGQAFISVSQIGDLKSTIVGKKEEGKNGLLAGGSALRGAAGAALGVAGGIFVAVQAISAIDKGYQVLNGTFDKSRNYISDLNESLKKYNVTLTDQQKKVSENIASKAGASGAGISGFFNSTGLTSIFQSADVSKIIQNISKTGLDAGANADLIKTLANQFSPQVSEDILKRTGKKATSKQIEEETTSKIAEQLEKIKKESFFERKISAITYNSNSNSDQERRKLELENPELFNLRQLQAKRSTALNPKERESLDAQILEKKKKIQEGYVELVFDESTYQKKIKKLIEDQAVPAQNAAIAEQQRQEALLFSSNLLKEQLNSYQQLAKLQSSIPSSYESELAIKKEILTTTEAQRMEIDRTLKSMQEQRQLTSEIKDAALTFGKGKIDTYLSSISGSLDVRKGISDKIKNSYLQIASSANQEEATKGVSNLIGNLRGFQNTNETEQEKANRENAILSLEEQLSTIKATSSARQFQNAIESQNLAIVKQQNFEISLRRDKLNSELNVMQKRIEFQKQELDLRRQASDIKFEASQVGRPAQRAAIDQARKNLEDSITRPKEDIKNQLAQYDVARKQSIANYLNQKNAKPEDVARIINENPEKQAKSIQKVLNDESFSLADQVKKSADYFYEAMVKSSALISEKLNPNQTTSEIYSQVSVDKLSKESLEDLINKTKKENEQKDIDLLSGEKVSFSSNLAFLERLQNRLKTLNEEPTLAGISLKDTKTNIEGIVGNPPPIEAQKKKNEEDTKYKQRLLDEQLAKTTFRGGATQAATDLQNEIDTFQNTLGKTIPMAFRNGMVSAMKELSNPNSTEPFKNRLLGVATAFVEKINDALMTNLANKATSGILGSFGIESKASGGPIMGGSGNKDDVPAMLMGGEYVINKSAVSKYGSDFFSALNSGKIKKFASGGWVESDVTKYQDPNATVPYGQKRDQGLSFDEKGSVIGMDSYTGSEENKADALKRAQTDYYAKNAQTGQGGFYMPGQNGMGAIMGPQNLLKFATQQTAGTRFDTMSGRGGSASIDIGAGSSNLSLFALRDEGNIRNQEYQKSREQAKELYFGELSGAKEKAQKEEEIRQEQERLKQEARTKERQMYQGLIRQMATSAAIAGVSALGSAALGGGSNAVKAANAEAMKSGGTPLSGMDKFKTFAGGMWSGGTLNGETAGGLSNAFNSSGYKTFQGFASGKNIYLFKGNSVVGGSDYGWEKQYSKPGGYWTGNSVYMRAAGGYIAGNGMGDNVPAMLNGGEFVMSRQATQNIGMNKLQQMNSGGKSQAGDSDAIVAKLDELVEKLNAVGSVNITVNSDSSKGKEESKSENSNEQTKELARKIKEVVMSVLRDEKRLGGMLR